MVAYNPSGPTGYPTPIGLADGSALISTEDGVPVLGPIFNASGTVVKNIINPALNQGVVGGVAVPPLNAILIELMVISELLALNFGSNPLDLTNIRASAAWSLQPTTGVIGQ